MSGDPSGRSISTVGTRRAKHPSLAALLVVLPACSIDDRHLSLSRLRAVDAGDPGSEGPRPDAEPASRPDADRGPLVTDGGKAADGGACPSDGAATCRGIVVVEAAFDRDTRPWESEPGVTLAWHEDDARGAPSSGSVSVLNANTGGADTWVFGAARRCVPAVGNAVYTLFGSALIAGGQGAGGAGLGVSFFSAADCTATPEATYDTPPTDKLDVWVALSGETIAPSVARSLLVRLVVPKRLSEPSFEANFDDVRVTRR
jgi:hypothetical protein